MHSVNFSNHVAYALHLLTKINTKVDICGNRDTKDRNFTHSGLKCWQDFPAQTKSAVTLLTPVLYVDNFHFILDCYGIPHQLASE